jgi:hypothetical protein
LLPGVPVQTTRSPDGVTPMAPLSEHAFPGRTVGVGARVGCGGLGSERRTWLGSGTDVDAGAGTTVVSTADVGDSPVRGAREVVVSGVRSDVDPDRLA